MNIRVDNNHSHLPFALRHWEAIRIGVMTTLAIGALGAISVGLALSTPALPPMFLIAGSVTMGIALVVDAVSFIFVFSIYRYKTKLIDSFSEKMAEVGITIDRFSLSNGILVLDMSDFTPEEEEQVLQEVCKLRFIKFLQLTGGQKSLPPEIGQLTLLETIVCDYVRRLPKEMLLLENLNHVDIRGGRYENFAKTVREGEFKLSTTLYTRIMDPERAEETIHNAIREIKRLKTTSELEEFENEYGDIEVTAAFGLISVSTILQPVKSLALIMQFLEYPEIKEPKANWSRDQRELVLDMQMELYSRCREEWQTALKEFTDKTIDPFYLSEISFQIASFPDFEEDKLPFAKHIFMNPDLPSLEAWNWANEIVSAMSTPSLPENRK